MCEETAVVRSDVIDVTDLSLGDLDSSGSSRLADAVRKILRSGEDGREAISGFTNTI
jgi:FXSXX-COOH protein